MPTYVAYVNWTEKGIAAVKDSPARADDFVRIAKSAGITINQLYWTTGAHDGLAIFDAADEAAASRLLLSVASGGHVRTQLARAFTRAEFARCLSE